MPAVAFSATGHQADDLFGRHLDLAPLRGRRRGLVRCIFQGKDRRPSLSVDLDRRLFNCFSCGERGGVRRFAELVGEALAPPRQVAAPRSEWDRAWLAVVRRAQDEAARRAEWVPWWLANDLIRVWLNTVRTADDWARILGPEHPRTWPLLELAARVQTAALADEAQLDALLAEARIA